MLAHARIVEGIDGWRYCTFRPSDSKSGLFSVLATALFRTEALGKELSAFGSNVEEFAGDLQNAPTAAMRQLRAAVLQAGTRINEVKNPTLWLAVVIDRFEEIFTLEGTTPAERDAFSSTFSLMAQSGFIWIVATCRSDFSPN